MPSQTCAGPTHVKPSVQRKPGAWQDGNGSKVVVVAAGDAVVGADVLAGNSVGFGSLSRSFVGSGNLVRSSFLAACALAGAPGSRMPVARSQERTRARVAASKVNPRMTEQSARTGDCLRAGGPNWCHIGLLESWQIITNSKASPDSATSLSQEMLLAWSSRYFIETDKNQANLI